MALLAMIFLTSHGAKYPLDPSHISSISSAKAIASLPLVPSGFLVLICFSYKPDKKNLAIGSELLRHYKTELMKHVLPKFYSPVKPMRYPLSRYFDIGIFIISDSVAYSSTRSFILAFLLAFTFFTFS